MTCLYCILTQDFHGVGDCHRVLLVGLDLAGVLAAVRLPHGFQEEVGPAQGDAVVAADLHLPRGQDAGAWKYDFLL